MATDGRITRVRAAIKRHGARGFARQGVRRASQRVRLCEAHVWYALRLSAVAALGALEVPLVLVRATEAQIGLVEQLGHSAIDARAWHEEGHDLWFVLDAGDVAFTCWTFRGRTPVAATRDGWLTLPPGIACLEDSITAPTHRGRGIAPRAWAAIAHQLRAEGIEQLITKVAVENAPSRKAVTKAGFREVALQRFERLGPRVRVTVEVLDQDPGAALRAALAR